MTLAAVLKGAAVVLVFILVGAMVINAIAANYRNRTGGR